MWGIPADKIHVFAAGFAEPEDEDLAEYIQEFAAEVAPLVVGSEWLNDFLRYVTERRMSKEGRFLTIHFETGLRCDVVPKGSIASGRGLEVDKDGQAGWRIIRANIDELRQEFLSKRTSPRTRKTTGSRQEEG